MSPFIIAAIVAIYGFDSCCCSKSSAAIELLNNLLNNASTDIRPGLDAPDPLVVNISLNLVALTELNEVKGYISTVAFLDITWVDERMTWQSANYEGISSISVDSRKVWTPPLIISNPSDKMYTPRDVPISVSYNEQGLAFFRPGFVMKTLCLIEIPAYPFDVHECSITFINWGILPSEVVIKSPLSIVSIGFYGNNPEWDLTKTSVADSIAGNQLSMVTFNLTFSRKPAFLTINVLIPIIFLSILNTVVFLLPHESGERVSFAITVLLSFTVFLNIIGDNIPKTSSPMPYLCYYVVIVMVTSGLITLSTILSQKLHHACMQGPVPTWLQICLFIYPRGSQTKISTFQPEDTKDYEQNKSTESFQTCNWSQVVSRLDKILFLFFFSLALALALGFTVSMANIE